jgi:3-oxoacyl-[acyl-carrier protein] reductase
MVQRGSGVILQLGGGGPQTLPGLGGFKIALDAMEGLRRQWAVELGPHKDAITVNIAQQTLLGRAATLADVGTVAAFVASDHARTLTATEVNISCGALID